MKTPGEFNQGTGENQPMATDAEQDNLILHADELFERAFEGYKALIEEPDEPMPRLLGVTPTEEELKRYASLSEWDEADIQYAPPYVNRSLPFGDPKRVHAARLVATFSSADMDRSETLVLSPSHIQEEAINEADQNLNETLGVSIVDGISRAKIQDLGALLTETVTPTGERLEFPGLPPEEPYTPPPTEQL